MEVAGVLALVVGGLALAGAGLVLSLAGVEMPAGVSATLSGAGDVLGWLRLAVVLVLGYGVVRARENV